MTLKEKFIPLVWFNYKSFNVYQNKEKDKNSNKCVEIADDYAIKFFEWTMDYCVEFYDSTERGNIYKFSNHDNKYTNKELLKMFKKEKGL